MVLEVVAAEAIVRFFCAPLRRIMMLQAAQLDIEKEQSIPGHVRKGKRKKASSDNKGTKRGEEEPVLIFDFTSMRRAIAFLYRAGGIRIFYAGALFEVLSIFARYYLQVYFVIPIFRHLPPLPQNSFLLISKLVMTILQFFPIAPLQAIVMAMSLNSVTDFLRHSTEEAEQSDRMMEDEQKEWKEVSPMGAARDNPNPFCDESLTHSPNLENASEMDISLPEGKTTFFPGESGTRKLSINVDIHEGEAEPLVASHLDDFTPQEASFSPLPPSKGAKNKVFSPLSFLDRSREASRIAPPKFYQLYQFFPRFESRRELLHTLYHRLPLRHVVRKIGVIEFFSRYFTSVMQAYLLSYALQNFVSSSDAQGWYRFAVIRALSLGASITVSAVTYPLGLLPFVHFTRVEHYEYLRKESALKLLEEDLNGYVVPPERSRRFSLAPLPPSGSMQNSISATPGEMLSRSSSMHLSDVVQELDDDLLLNESNLHSRKRNLKTSISLGNWWVEAMFMKVYDVDVQGFLADTVDNHGFLALYYGWPAHVAHIIACSLLGSAVHHVMAKFVGNEGCS